MLWRWWVSIPCTAPGDHVPSQCGITQGITPHNAQVRAGLEVGLPHVERHGRDPSQHPSESTAESYDDIYKLAPLRGVAPLPLPLPLHHQHNLLLILLSCSCIMSCSAFLPSSTTIRHQNSIRHYQGIKRSQSDITVRVGLMAIVERVVPVEGVVILRHVTRHPYGMIQ